MSRRARLLIGCCLAVWALAAGLVAPPASDAAEHPYNKGCELMSDGEYARAAEQFKKALKLNSKDTDALNNLAVCRIKLEQYDTALPLLEKVLDINARYSGAHLNIGADYLLQDELSLALPPTRRAESASGSVLARKVKADAFYNLGLIYALRGDHERAADAFQRSNEVRAANDALMARGAALCAAGNFDAGISLLEKAAREASGTVAERAAANVSVAYYKRALQRLAAHDVKGAQADIDMAMDAGPTDAVRLAAGMVQAESGDVQGAVETFTDVQRSTESEAIADVAQRNIDHALELLGQEPATGGGGGWTTWLMWGIGIVVLVIVVVIVVRVVRRK